MQTRFPDITKREVRGIFDAIDVDHNKRVSYGKNLLSSSSYIRPDEFSKFAKNNPIYTKVAKEIIKKRQSEQGTN